jgi:hypothetical protein
LFALVEHERHSSGFHESAACIFGRLPLTRTFSALFAPFLAAALLCCANANAATATAGAAQTIIHLNATSVNFYYDRFLLEAEGNVHVTTSDGMTMTGDAFSMDLKLNRFVLAGHVHMQNPSGSQDGAALADFLDYNRIYFVPITTEPDRWTFLDGDFAHPAKGREMPGDTFFFPDLGDAKPFLVSDSATIGSRSFLRFGGNHIDVANGLGAYIPLPSYYVNFSTDRHLGENSLSGANWDATWELAGGANAITALHFRYDTVNKTYMSLEQHLSGKKAYAVFSVNPMTRPQKFWNLVLSDQPSDRFQVRTFTQLATNQHWLSSPAASGQFTIVQATDALPHSFLQLAVQDTNQSLLPPGVHHGVGAVIDHPWQMNLSAQTFDHRIGHTPFYEHIGYGIGYVHDAGRLDGLGRMVPLQTLQGTPYTTIWNHNLDVVAYVPSFKLGNSYLIEKNYYLNASFEKNRQWFSVPHYIDTTTTRFSLSKELNKHFISFLGYSIENLGDYYGKLQTTVYPSFVPVVDGVKYPGYAAFRGLATFRELSFDLTYTNGGNVSASLLARKHVDFPKPIPNFFATPPLDILGNQILGGQPYLGEPPYDITADVRLRLNAHTSIDISRAYYFHFGNRGWSPEFVIQVMQ